MINNEPIDGLKNPTEEAVDNPHKFAGFIISTLYLYHIYARTIY
jgi:hypothetical protein